MFLQSPLIFLGWIPMMGWSWRVSSEWKSHLPSIGHTNVCEMIVRKWVDASSGKNTPYKMYRDPDKRH